MRALITGVTGQDGAYLSQLLLNKGYEVFGARRRCTAPNTDKLKRLGVEVEMVPFELGEYENIKRTIQKVKPDEIYNLAAMSFVGDSFELPLYTVDVNGLGVLRILEAIRGTNIRLYQASTSEMFGNAAPRQTEDTPFVPRSPYGCGKLLAHSLCRNYREAYGTKASCGILFNHESPLRGEEFVTQKIARGVWSGNLTLGNLDAKRDWGHARDYVEAMWLMLQSDADDYVIATGVARSVRAFVQAAEKAAGVKCAVEIDPRFYRPTEVNHLCGDATKAFEKLNWEPKISFEGLVKEMVREAQCSTSTSDTTQKKSQPTKSAPIPLSETQVSQSAYLR
jgi:GDPmannose 4,6-dehydratase